MNDFDKDFLLHTVSALGLAALVMLMIWGLSGCAKRVEVFDCRCDCNETSFECVVNEHTIRTDLQ